jgi:hypothetical protein
MADPTLPIPPARGDSKSADPHKVYLLDLPPEIRNKIYAHLVEFRNPITIRFSRPEKLRLRLDSIAQVPVDLFLVCRTLYHDVASAFYVKNTFSLIPENHKYFFSHYSFVEIRDYYLTSLGSQARWIRKLELDLTCLEKQNCYRGRALHGHIFDEHQDLRRFFATSGVLVQESTSPSLEPSTRHQLELLSVCSVTFLL